MPAHERMVLFCDRMTTELGYKHAYGWQIFSRQVGGKVMYHMIHATDHDEGPRLMNRAYRNALKRREPADLLQRSLEEIWGAPGGRSGLTTLGRQSSICETTPLNEGRKDHD